MSNKTNELEDDNGEDGTKNEGHKEPAFKLEVKFTGQQILMSLRILCKNFFSLWPFLRDIAAKKK
jgi:hypothetical protein